MRSSQITLGKLNSLLARCSLIGQSTETPLSVCRREPGLSSVQDTEPCIRDWVYSVMNEEK